MPCEGVDDQEGLVRVLLDSLGEFGSDLENFLVSWSVIQEIFIVSAIICNLVPGAHNSYLFDVSSTLQKLFHAVLHLDSAPLVLVAYIVELCLDLLPARIVGDRSVPDEAGVVCYVWVVLDFVFETLRLHVCLQ